MEISSFLWSALNVGGWEACLFRAGWCQTRKCQWAADRHPCYCHIPIYIYIPVGRTIKGLTQTPEVGKFHLKYHTELYELFHRGDSHPTYIFIYIYRWHNSSSPIEVGATNDNTQPLSKSGLHKAVFPLKIATIYRIYIVYFIYASSVCERECFTVITSVENDNQNVVRWKCDQFDGDSIEEKWGWSNQWSLERQLFC